LFATVDLRYDWANGLAVFYNLMCAITSRSSVARIGWNVATYFLIGVGMSYLRGFLSTSLLNEEPIRCRL
jgi:hypothetical protein